MKRFEEILIDYITREYPDSTVSFDGDFITIDVYFEQCDDPDCCREITVFDRATLERRVFDVYDSNGDLVILNYTNITNPGEESVVAYGLAEGNINE